MKSADGEMRIRYVILLFLLAFAVAYALAKILRPIILNIGVEKNICPNCGSSYIRKSSRRKGDLPYRIFGLRPFRCTLCEVRFFAFREPSEIGAASGSRTARVR
jgi:transposase-like protein